MKPDHLERSVKFFGDQGLKQPTKSLLSFPLLSGKMSILLMMLAVKIWGVLEMHPPPTEGRDLC